MQNQTANRRPSTHASRVRAAALTLILCVAAAPALSQWVGVLKNTPAERFDEEDMRLFLEAARKAVNELPVNETARWENPATGSRGDLTVRKAFQWKERQCREVSVHNEAGGRKATTVNNLCRIDGKWRLVSPSELKK